MGWIGLRVRFLDFRFDLLFFASWRTQLTNKSLETKAVFGTGARMHAEVFQW